MMAAEGGHNETVKTLIAAGANGRSLKVRIYYCLTTHPDTHTLLMRYHTQLMYSQIYIYIHACIQKMCLN